MYASIVHRIRTARHAFEMLGVHAGSSNADVSAARKTLARVLHPDVNTAHDAAALMAEVNAAHTALTGNRALYIMSLRLKKCTTCGGAGFTTRQQGFTKRIATACKACGGAGVR